MSDALTRFLSLYPAHARPALSPVSMGNAGGGSGARLWRFESGIGPLVARAWPPDGPGPAALAQIHRWLANAADLDFVPVPLETRDGRTLVEIDDRRWELAPWCRGVSDPGRPPSVVRLRAAFAGLAAFHQRLAFSATFGPSPGLGARLEEADELLRSELSRIRQVVTNSPPDSIRDTAIRWEGLARDGLPSVAARLRREASVAIALQPVLRDARPEHFLFEDDHLTGLVDFGAMGIDAPAADLARLLGEWTGRDLVARSEALAAYTSIRPLEPREAELIDVFAESAAWLGPARWVRWHFLEHRPFDDPDAVRRGLERALDRLIERIAPGPTSSVL
jgi:Ser/Thr protein kinase RdoA (MazF antagonist)